MVVWVVRWAALLCASLLAVLATQAFAQGQFTPGSTCFIADPSGAGFRTLASTPRRWNCDRSDWSIAENRTILRFDLRGARLDSDAAFATGLTRFHSLRITVIGTDGESASKLLTQDTMDLATHDWVMSTALPRIGQRPTTVYAEIDRPRHLRMLTDARISAPPNDDAAGHRIELLLAAMGGLLIVPFVYNLAFYHVLRERFLLWHAVAVVCMLVHTFVSSGLINHFVHVSLLELSIISVLSWSAGIAAAGLFIINLVEPGKLDPWHRRVAGALGGWTLACSLFYLTAGGTLRAWAAPVYFASFAPVIAFLVLVMAVAARRGSRAIRIQIIAWTPMILVGGLRTVTSIGLFGIPLELMMAQHFAIALEVVITSLGVADRFMTIKRERDSAMAETRHLERQAERDALTGLLNRRAVGRPFAALHAAGFDTMAVIDLDHFKQVNDTHGHTVGDEVLRSVAEALAPDDDTLAVRMGGEEFMLLLRGPGANARAERRRQAITSRVAMEVPGLALPVTASMGLVEQPHCPNVRADFLALYAHCDRLLYEAKRAGRNRTMSEKVTRFDVKARPGLRIAS